MKCRIDLGNRCKYLSIWIFLLLSTSGWSQDLGKSRKEGASKGVIIATDHLKLELSNGDQKAARIISMEVNGQPVVTNATGVYTAVKVDGQWYNSLHLKTLPVIESNKNITRLKNIAYGNQDFTIKEDWIFTKADGAIKWDIVRDVSHTVVVEQEGLPVFNFDHLDTWEGAYQGYGGLAWFRLFDEKKCTYGVHTSSSSFWNSKTSNGLDIKVDAPGKQIGMSYTRTNRDGIAFNIAVDDQPLQPHYDSGTHRRRFIRNKTDVWTPFSLEQGRHKTSLTLRYFDFNKRYGRGTFKGIDGQLVNGVLNTIARMGVIDSLHFGGNSWHTPYGPICLHEQYIANIGLGLGDPAYQKGYQSSLSYYCTHAIQPDGRVYARWAYTNEDRMGDKGNEAGFYEAQWGILMDANPDLVTNIAALFDQTGDQQWVKSLQPYCEKALNWILARDFDHNGLVEMMTDRQSEQKSSDWIDVIWASYENAFVNAKLYHALVKWAAIEALLDNQVESKRYTELAAKLKAAFNKPIEEGGFWDEKNGCYVYWIDKDKEPHGRNMVIPVNFMAIAYDICDNPARKKVILDKIEQQMVKEELFFWPLCLTSYAKGEGRKDQFPFPNYENGDIFLSWGALGVKSYASYRPEIALKYVKNVLKQYQKDGLAFQRYGRVKQNGLGDDILSGNCLAVVGLFESIYGIHPLYNRLYLEPHLTPELFGTSLVYKYHGQSLSIQLDKDQYAVANDQFSVQSDTAFGMDLQKDQLSIFQRNNKDADWVIKSGIPIAVVIQNWSQKKVQWTQSRKAADTKNQKGKINYHFKHLLPQTGYQLYEGNKSRKLQTDAKGDLIFKVSAGSMPINIQLKAAAS